ncbi:TetR/AcrR family transcriptional regulator [Actinomadura viridis]|uniref:AcrR family transcriptional regulator n=1 Tax=Actinomadura viridis TaxID=58110 RepID=A0A931GM44_9ACTN|nr:TetR/AcrR family transcriptional regulator [Actinomadura viridis]MBG6088116.1 AcrR family transcriptional regulator [Actinomadura viridis]
MPSYEPARAGKGLRADAQRNRARILEAAEAVFAAKGPAASTEEIALRAGVGIGTVFRHFPTKEALLQAIIGRLADRLAEDTASLAEGGDPGTAFFTFFAGMVERAARTKTVIDLLAEAGIAITVAKPIRMLRESIEDLLTNAQHAGTVRRDVRVTEVIALLIGVCQAALHTAWDPGLRERTLAIVFDGLRPAR